MPKNWEFTHAWRALLTSEASILCVYFTTTTIVLCTTKTGLLWPFFGLFFLFSSTEQTNRSYVLEFVKLKDQMLRKMWQDRWHFWQRGKRISVTFLFRCHYILSVCFLYFCNSFKNQNFYIKGDNSRWKNAANSFIRLNWFDFSSQLWRRRILFHHFYRQQ